MFSHTELATIKEWAEIGKTMLLDQINSSIFTHKEKEEKRAEYRTLESVITEVILLEEVFVPVDADQLGHILVAIEDWRMWVIKQCEDGKMSAHESMNRMFELGKMCSHASMGFFTDSDCECFNKWNSEEE